MADKIINSFDVWIAAQGWKSKLRLRSVDNISLEGIARLRELILDLGVKGKLVPQDPSEEPASILLKKIIAERNRLIKEKKIKDKSIDTIRADEQPFHLPKGWEWARFPMICETNVGRTPSTKNPAFWADGMEGKPWVSISDMVDKAHINETTKHISNQAAKSVFKDQLVPAGTLLMSFKLTVGKISILGIDAFHNEAIISIRPFGEMSRDYLFLILPTIAQSGKTKKAIMGSTLNATSLGLLLIPVPPLAEQHRIVAKVDELMALCDELEQQESNHLKSHQLLVETLLGTLTQAKDAAEFHTAWATLAQHFDDLFITEDSIDQLKQTVLQLAVMGKLVPQDPRDEPASVLLERIKKEKERLVKVKKIKREKPLPSISDADKPLELPEKWMWCRFGDLLRSMAYGTSQKTDDNEHNVPVLRMGNITSDGKLTYGNLKYISPDHYDLPNLYLENGDIVFNRTNSYELVGKSGVYKGSSNCYTLASYLIKASPFVELTNSDFLNLYINSPICRKTQIEPEITAQTNQANFSGSKLKNILLPLPPTKEQNRIVAKVDELFALCDSLKERITESQKVVNQMADSILEQVNS